MLGRSSTSPLLAFDSGKRSTFLNYPYLATTTPGIPRLNLSFSDALPSNVIRGSSSSRFSRKMWIICTTTQTDNLVLNDEEKKSWKECREALSAFDFSVEEKDKILGKAFGHVNSPYWGEERKRQVPRYEIVTEIIAYLQSLGLTDEDVYKVIKRFPEVLGCSLESELKQNVNLLEKDWAIKGKTLRNLLLRNPKVLGYNVDCKGDCMAQCTRCWVRF